jgi:hypothetical protein
MGDVQPRHVAVLSRLPREHCAPTALPIEETIGLDKVLATSVGSKLPTILLKATLDKIEACTKFTPPEHARYGRCQME